MGPTWKRIGKPSDGRGTVVSSTGWVQLHKEAQGITEAEAVKVVQEKIEAGVLKQIAPGVYEYQGDNNG